MAVPFPVDLAAESLAKTNALTYPRLEGYGHDLDTADVQDAAGRWLASILFGQELSDGILAAQADLSALASSEDSQADMSDYVFSRGKHRDNDDGGGRGEVRGGVETNRDSNGNERYSASGTASYDFGNGLSAEVSGGGSISKDKDGNVSAEAHGRAEIRQKF